jgi:integrase
MYSIDKTKCLSDQEIALFKANLRSNGGRDSIALEVLLNTGARSCELIALTVSDFDFSNNSIYLRGAKGSENRSVPVNSELMEKAKRDFRNRGLVSSDRPFNFCTRQLRSIWYNFRPVNKKIHSLRHTFAIQLYKFKNDLRLVQYALGHRNIANTMVYASYIYKTEELNRLTQGFKI